MCFCVAESTRSATSLGSLPSSLRSTESDPSTWTLPTLPWRDWELNLDDLRVRRTALSEQLIHLSWLFWKVNKYALGLYAHLCPPVPTCAAPYNLACVDAAGCPGCERRLMLCREPDFCFGGIQCQINYWLIIAGIPE